MKKVQIVGYINTNRVGSSYLILFRYQPDVPVQDTDNVQITRACAVSVDHN